MKGSNNPSFGRARRCGGDRSSRARDIAAWLEAVLAEVEATDDVSYFAHALGGGGTRNMSQLARDARMSRKGSTGLCPATGIPPSPRS